MAERFSLSGKKIWVAGETGLVGSALCRALSHAGVERLSAPRASLDLTDQHATREWLSINRPDAVFIAAARVGGIGANMREPANFIYENLAIAQNVIDGCHRAGIDRLIFLGSSCIYPREAPRPIREEYLLTGLLEPTNEAYAIAKIAGLKMCEYYSRQYGRSFFSAMPTNLYGPGDRFDEHNSHVIPALMMKFAGARERGETVVKLWGSGQALREFLHVDDLARALIVMMERYDESGPVNIGSGAEVTINGLAAMIAKVTGFKGEIAYDTDQPDGTPRKLLDSSRMMALGWQPETGLKRGLAQTYEWFCRQIAANRAAWT